MSIIRKQIATIPAIRLHASITILSGFLLCVPLKAQDRLRKWFLSSRRRFAINPTQRLTFKQSIA